MVTLTELMRRQIIQKYKHTMHNVLRGWVKTNKGGHRTEKS